MQNQIQFATPIIIGQTAPATFAPGQVIPFTQLQTVINDLRSRNILGGSSDLAIPAELTAITDLQTPKEAAFAAKIPSEPELRESASSFRKDIKSGKEVGTHYFVVSYSANTGDGTMVNGKTLLPTNDPKLSSLALNADCFIIIKWNAEREVNNVKGAWDASMKL